MPVMHLEVGGRAACVARRLPRSLNPDRVTCQRCKDTTTYREAKIERAEDWLDSIAPLPEAGGRS